MPVSLPPVPGALSKELAAQTSELIKTAKTNRYVKDCI